MSIKEREVLEGIEFQKAVIEYLKNKHKDRQFIEDINNFAKFDMEIKGYDCNYLMEIKSRRIKSTDYVNGGNILMPVEKVLSLLNHNKPAFVLTVFADGVAAVLNLRKVQPYVIKTMDRINQVERHDRSDRIHCYYLLDNATIIDWVDGPIPVAKEQTK